MHGIARTDDDDIMTTQVHMFTMFDVLNVYKKEVYTVNI